MGYKLNPFTGNLDATDSPNGVFEAVEVNGDITLDDGGTYATTLQLITPTANRTISFPDATGTVALVGGSSGQLVYNNAGAQAGLTSASIGSTGEINISLAGAASTPPVSFTGSWFTGGTSTTTKPQLLIEPTGTTSTAWSTSGTGLGVNAASGFSGRLLDLQTNGTSQMVVQGDGKLGIGTTSPSAPLHVTSSIAGGIVNITSTSTSAALVFNDSGTGGNYPKIGSEGSNLVLRGGAVSSAAYIDASGRLLVGTSTSRGNLYNAASNQDSRLQLEGTDYKTAAGSFTCNSNTATDSPILTLNRTRGTAVGSNSLVSADDLLGVVVYQGNDGSEFVQAARIACEVDGTPGANDMPGRLVFSTTADGASSPTERMRIKSNGTINFSSVSVYADNTAALAGGLVAGDVYRKSDGTLMITY